MSRSRLLLVFGLFLLAGLTINVTIGSEVEVDVDGNGNNNFLSIEEEIHALATMFETPTSQLREMKNEQTIGLMSESKAEDETSISPKPSSLVQVSSLLRVNSAAPKRKAPKRKAPKRKAPKRKAPKRKAPKRKAPKKKGTPNHSPITIDNDLELQTIQEFIPH